MLLNLNISSFSESQIYQLVLQLSCVTRPYVNNVFHLLTYPRLRNTQFS